MIKLLRKHRDWLMIVIAILTVPFCIYFVKSEPGLIGKDEFAQIYGRKVSMIEARRDARLFEVARNLGMFDFLRDMTAGAPSGEQMIGQFALNLIVLRHEAGRLGLEPSEAEIVEAVRSFPAFIGQSGFDTAKYDDFVQNVLSSYGFSDEQLKDLARDELCLKQIKQILSTAISIPESETKSNYEQLYGKSITSVVRLHTADFTKDVKVSDEDVKKYYDAHKAELKTEEKRKVEVVRLALTDEQKKLTGKERIDALQKLADRANDVSQALLEKAADFHQVAAKFQLPVQATAEFTATNPDPQLKADSQLSQAAFKLTQQEPNSDPIQSADGFCILHLAGIVEARPLTLDEAKRRIVDEIKNNRAREMVMTKGHSASQTLREGLKLKQPLQFILEKAGGLKADKVEPFAVADLADEKNPPDKPKNEPADMVTIKNITAQLQPGDVSDFVPSADGGLIVLLEKRDPPDPAKYEQNKATFEARVRDNQQEFVFLEWLRDRQRDADVRFAVAKS